MCSSRVSYLEASDGNWPLIVDVNCDPSLQVLSNIPTLSRVTISYLATSKHSLGKHFKNMQVICSLSKFPSMFSIQWKFWPESVFTTMAAKWGFSNSRVLSRLPVNTHGIINKNLPFLPTYLSV